jgi:hypothetical protein
MSAAESLSKKIRIAGLPWLLAGNYEKFFFEIMYLKYWTPVCSMR